MKKIFILNFLFVSLFLFFQKVNADNPFSLNFPISELGNCGSYGDCKAYCDSPTNAKSCFDFAKKNKLVAENDLKTAEDVLNGGGPGGCRSQEECKSYCNNSTHADECLSFAKKHGLLSQDQIDKTKKSADLNNKIATQGGPGGCRSKEECQNYCKNPNNFSSCVKFAKDNGFISDDQAQNFNKSFSSGPGGCKGKNECESYCEAVEHQKECVDFAEQNGFMKHDDAEKARKFAGKTGPGGCQGEECFSYCQDPDHQEECLNFAKDNGLISSQEANHAQDFIANGGPGGCKTPKDCQQYCESNPEECFKFVRQKGFVRPEDQKNFEVGQQLRKKLQESGGPGGCKSEKECKSYCSDPGHVEECIAFASAHANISAQEARNMLEDFAKKQLEANKENFQENFEDLKQERLNRFEQFRRLEEDFRGDGQNFQDDKKLNNIDNYPNPDMTKFNGPGGCTSPAECIKYCSSHFEECAKFRDSSIFHKNIINNNGNFPGLPITTAPNLGPRPLPINFDLGQCKDDPEKCKAIFNQQNQNQNQQDQEIKEINQIPPKTTICPKIPTVDYCPSGQTRFLIFSSPNCGTYYGCREEKPSLNPENLPSDPAQKCAAVGGTWKDNTCVMPPSSFINVLNVSVSSLINSLGRLFIR